MSFTNFIHLTRAGDQPHGFQQLFHFRYAAFTEMPGEQPADGEQPCVNHNDRCGPRLVAAGQFVNQPRATAGIVRTLGFTAVQQRLGVTQRNFIAV